MRGHWRIVGAVASALVLGAPAVASAEGEDDIEMEGDEAAPAPVDDPKVARKALASARQLVRKGDRATRAKQPDEAKVHYSNAADELERAIAAGADLATYLELAAVEEKLGLVDKAAAHYRLVIETQGARADLVKRATARYDELTTQVGLVTIVVKPDGATVTIDGKLIGTTPLAAPLVLAPGTYAIALAAEGHTPRETEIKVEAGSESERSLELEPIAPEVPVPAPAGPVVPEVAPAAPAPGPSKTPMVIAGGAALTLAGVAAVTGVLAVGKHATFDDDTASPADREAARDSGQRLALITDLCLAGAAVGAGVAAYWYVARYRPAQRERAREAPAQVGAKVDVVPWVQSAAGGVTVLGSF